MNQYVNGHASYRVERVEQPHRIRGREPEYVLSLANDDEGLRTNGILYTMRQSVRISKDIFSDTQSRERARE